MELLMAADVLRDLGPVFLGSRLKRLAERMQAGAARIIIDAGLPLQPAQVPLLAALDRGPLTVGQLVEAVGASQPGVTRAAGQLVALGLVRSARGKDQRRRTLSLTPAGEAAMARIRRLVWPRVEQAVAEICAGLSGSLLEQIGGVEAALAARPLDARVAAIAPAGIPLAVVEALPAPRPPDLPLAPTGGLAIRDYDDSLAGAFRDINAEWIGTMFRMEPADREVLDRPREAILDPGGAILFVEMPGRGVIGTCALRKAEEGVFELTKMAVREAARGRKAGEFLLIAAIARARRLGAGTLYLLTNSACAPAIHLYEKNGFRHDAGIMARYGARYERCDVAMRYVG
jgi:DNA-binding MarR family transcriptional regulator/N-acetylglutamate synthase-like GNAT family acetyltransferase